MKIIVDNKILNIDDIAECHCINPHEYHIEDMDVFLEITLKNGEKIVTTNAVHIMKDE